MLYVYFIARSQPEIEAAHYRTLSGEPLAFVRQGDLLAAVGATGSGGRLTPGRMLEYNGIVATASRVGTVLPLRLGAEFPSRQAIEDLLADRQRELVEALTRLEAKIEIGLRLPLEHPGQALETAARLLEKTDSLDVWFEVQTSADGRRILEVALLVPSDEASRCQARLALEAFAASVPRPPLHFLPKFLRMPVQAERRVRPAAARRA